MQQHQLILGQPGPTTDTYVHDLDVQQIVIELWGVGNMTGDWKRTAFAMATVLDLIKTATGGDGGQLADDLTFLLDLCYARDGRTAWPVLRRPRHALYDADAYVVNWLVPEVTP